MPTENKNAAEAAEVAEVEVAEQEVAEAEQAAEGDNVAEVEAETGEKPEGEQPEKPAAEQKPKPGKPNPFRARISELTAKNRELQAQLAERKPAPQEEEAEPGAQPPSNEFVPVKVVNDLVRQGAAKLAADQRFDIDCNAAFEQGTKSFADFEEAMANFSDLGGLERDVIEDALATGAAHQVLYELGSNPDRATRLLKLPSKQRIAEFTKMTLKEAPKPSISKASPPIKPVGGNAKKDFDPLDTSISDEEWHRQEDARERAQRKRA